MGRILFVFTSTAQTLTGAQAGWYLPEAVYPYYVLSPHHDIDFAAPKGPNPPMDESSRKLFQDDECVRFLNDEIVKNKLDNAFKLSEVSAQDYDAIFHIGGYGPVLDLASDPAGIKLVSDFYRAGKVTSAVCHGSAALVNATDASGKPVVQGKAVTGFSNAEKEQVSQAKETPFLLEDKIKSLGGLYEKAPELWGAKVVVSGNLITGQNPASARGVGEAILQALSRTQ
ncbi:class I glutamine amidotransferase-like protein [Sparassis latifolia]